MTRDRGDSILVESGDHPVTECRLCSNQNHKYLFSREGWDVVRCADCGLAQLAREPSEKELVEVYREAYFKRGKYEIEQSGMDRAADLEQQRRLNWLMKAGVPSGSKVLDVGCATGDFVIVACDRFEVSGMDVSEFAIKEARQRSGLSDSRLQAGSIYAPPFNDEKFDAIVIWDVIEHLNNPHIAVQQICSMLSPGGVVLCSTPNFGAPIAKTMKSRWAFMTPPEHICFYDRETLTKLFQYHGLSARDWMTRGKHANVGFLAYKARRMFPQLVHKSVVDWLGQSAVGNWTLYIPTGDIQYIAATKKQ